MQLQEKGVPMGGTRWEGRIRGREKKHLLFRFSAGTAILGQYVYTAEFDSVLSSEALNDPYYYRVTIGTDFLG